MSICSFCFLTCSCVVCILLLLLVSSMLKGVAVVWMSHTMSKKCFMILQILCVYEFSLSFFPFFVKKALEIVWMSLCTLKKITWTFYLFQVCMCTFCVFLLQSVFTSALKMHDCFISDGENEMHTGPLLMLLLYRMPDNVPNTPSLCVFHYA